MTKERIILAFVAILAGVLVASSIYYFYSQKKDFPFPQNLKPTQAPKSNEPQTMQIQSPENNSITDQKSTEVKGKAKPKSVVVVTTDDNDYVLPTDESGNFSKTIPLTENENTISVTSYPQSGQPESQKLLITYTTEEF